MHRIFRHSVLCASLMLIAISCSRIDDNFMYIGARKQNTSSSCTENAERTALKEPRRILLLYSLGVNNLRNSLLDDIEDLSSLWLPGGNRQENMLMVFSHSGVSGANFTTPAEPVLFSVSKSTDGMIVRDTLRVWSADKVGSSAEMVNEVLSFIQDFYSCASCGVVFTSHASGWLPDNYYDTISKTDKGKDEKSASENSTNAGNGTVGENSEDAGNVADGGNTQNSVNTGAPQDSRNIENTEERSTIKRSFGVQVVSGGNNKEINIDELAAAIPFKLDYIVFDACLMAGIEVAYEFKDACRLFVASPTEILADGFDYVNMCERLLSGEEADVLGVCEDYYNHYVSKNSYATISCIDCGELEPLAEVCEEIYSAEGRREKIDALPETDIQRYYRGRYHWFYDLKSVLTKLDLTDAENAALDRALEKAVIYNKATSKFLSILINEHCGLSTYLPSRGSDYLDSWYQRLKWNQRTGYVRLE